jgi:hypothetical protein
MKFFCSNLATMFVTEGFLGWVFFGIGSTLIDAHTLSGQTEGLKVGCGKTKGFIKTKSLGCRIHGEFMADSWRMGLQKLISVTKRNRNRVRAPQSRVEHSTS